MKIANSERQTALEHVVQIEPWIDDCELRELERVIQSTFVIEHELTREFEALTARLTGAKHAIAVCNGTVALFVCLRALGIGRGDEVIIPDLTFAATANAVILAGAEPVLCEIREDTFCIDMEKAETLLTNRTRAVMPKASVCGSMASTSERSVRWAFCLTTATRRSRAVRAAWC